ncbi:LppP/LprE family lipoprotein [Streptomyces sp. NPDC049040]|uniref:LppP/LprE family lipoprotein n=1 Tax=Streptomyces sp. NPDC049040 TaxID=3365593 RepID=UPI003710D88E
MEPGAPHDPRRRFAFLIRRAVRAGVLLTSVAVAASLVGGDAWGRVGAGAGTRSGTLAVSVIDLPSRTAADIALTGPGGFARKLTGGARFTRISPGAYALTARPVGQAGGDLYPTVPRLTVVVGEGAVATAEVDYADLVPRTTKILDATHAGLLSLTDGRMTFASDTPPVGGLRPGDVIVMGAGPLTPHGTMRRATAVRRDPRGRVAVDTRPATLRDAMPQGKIKIRDAQLAGVHGTAAAPDQAGLRPAPASASGGPRPPGSGPLRQTSWDARPLSMDGDAGSHPELSLGGDLTTFFKREALEGKCSASAVPGASSPGLAKVHLPLPRFDMDVDWRPLYLGVRSASFSLTFREGTDFDLATGAFSSWCGMSWQDPKPSVVLGVFPVQLGPVPAVFVLSGALVGALGIGAKADLSFAFDQKAELTAGLTWAKGKPGKIADFHNDFSITKAPSSTIEASAKAGLRLSLTVDDLVGPNLDITAGCGLAVSGDPVGAGKIEARCGLDASAGFEFDFLGYTVLNIEVGDLYHNEKVYYSREWKPGAVVSTPPPTSAPPVFDPGPAKRFIEDMGYTLKTAPPADDPGPLYAFTACACGDGSVNRVFFFLGSRYVGFADDFHAEATKQDGSSVTVGYQKRSPTDPQCCASGPWTTYQVHWDGSRLSSPAQISEDEVGPAVALYSVCPPPDGSRDALVEGESVVGSGGNAVLKATPASFFCAPGALDDGGIDAVAGSRTYRFAPGATIQLLMSGGTQPTRVSLAQLTDFLQQFASQPDRGGIDFSVRLDSQGRITYLSQFFRP